MQIIDFVKKKRKKYIVQLPSFYSPKSLRPRKTKRLAKNYTKKEELKPQLQFVFMDKIQKLHYDGYQELIQPC